MTKQKQPPTSGGNAEVDLLFLKMRGDSAGMAKGISDIIGTLQRQGGYVIAPGQTPPPAALSARATNGVTEESQAQTTFEGMLVPTPAPTAVEEAATAPASTQTKRHRAAPKAPELSTHLRPDDPPSLADFVAKTTLTKDSTAADQAIVIAMWMKQDRNLTEMTGSDYYTCCKMLGWGYPTDITQPLRGLKHQDKLDSKGGKFSITIIGEKHFATLVK